LRIMVLPRLEEVFVGEDAVPVQSKFVLKPPRSGAVVPPHVDDQYIYGDADSASASDGAFWIPLVDADAANGCVEVSVGSHLEEYARRAPKFSVDALGGPARLPRGDATWVAATRSAEFRKVEMRAGDALFMHPLLLHRSAKNKSARARPALTVHFQTAPLGAGCWLGG